MGRSRRLRRAVARGGLQAAVVCWVAAATACAPPDGAGGASGADHLEAARTLVEDGAHDSAVVRYTLALETGADPATAVRERGVVRAAQGKHRLAAADLDSALALRPGDPETLAPLSVVLLELGRWDRAAGILDSLVEARPDDAKVHYDRAHAHRGLGRMDRALEDLDRALELDPAMGEAYVARGAIHARRSDLNAAVSDFERAVSLTGSEAARKNLGIARLRGGDHEEADSIFTELLGRAPLEARYHLYRARARRRLGRGAEAAEDFRRVLELTGNPALRRQVIEALRELEAGS